MYIRRNRRKGSKACVWEQLSQYARSRFRQMAENPAESARSAAPWQAALRAARLAAEGIHSGRGWKRTCGRGIGTVAESQLGVRNGVEITVRLDDGTLRAVTQEVTKEVFRVGERVQIGRASCR